MMKKQSRHAHVDQVLFMIISIIVVYEHDVGLKSSITADTAFRKDLPCRGVPTAHYMRRMLAHLSQFLPLRGNHFMIWFREIRNDIIPLTNNEQIRVAPGESTSNPKSGRALGSASSVSTGFGSGPSPVKGGPTGKPCLRWPGVFEKYWRPTSTHTVSNGKSAWATTGNV